MEADVSLWADLIRSEHVKGEFRLSPLLPLGFFFREHLSIGKRLKESYSAMFFDEGPKRKFNRSLPSINPEPLCDFLGL